jgi:hypothetical protein
MNKRPKSREETPKEGSDRARPYRTATICGRAAQNARGFGSVRAQSGTGWRIGNTIDRKILATQNQLLMGYPQQDLTRLQCWYAKTRNFVMAGLTKNPRLNEAFPKADSKAGSQ